MAHGAAIASKEWKVVGAAFDSTSKDDSYSLLLLKQNLNDCLWFCRGEVNGIRQGGGTCLGLEIGIVNGFNSYAKCDQLVRAAWSAVAL